MTNVRHEPTEAEILASIVTGHGSSSYRGAAVQRSHRFPLDIFIQIENMARAGGVPVSLIINQLIECGLGAVKKELPEDVVKQLTIASKEQIERPLKQERVEVKGRNLTTRKKPKSK